MNRRAFVLGAAMVLLCNLVAVTLRSYAEAAFLASYGAAKLPWLLIANAGGFAVATFAYDAITRRAHTRVVDVALLALLLVAAAIAPTLLDAGASPVVLVVALAAISQVAGLALWNRVAASVAGRDARRMLPRAGAAVTLGGAIAGLGAGALVYRLGVTVLPYVGAAATLVVLALAIAQAKALAAGGAPGATAPPGTPEGLGPVQKKLLRALIVVALLEGVVATVIDLQFIATLKGRYSGNDLATAVTLFYGGTNAILFVLQVAAVPRILVTRSLPTTASIHPILAIAWYAVFVAAPGFVAIAGTRTADQVLRLATSRTSQEIELSAFPPGPRARWKVLLRGGVWSAGAALGALVLLLVGPVALRHPTELAASAVAVALVWFVVAQIAARRFQTALAAPLGIRAHRGEDLRRIDLETLERWAEVAGGADERRAALARTAIGRARVAASDLEEHLRHDDPAVRAALYAQLSRAPAPELRAELRAAVQIEDDDRALARGLEAIALSGDEPRALAPALARGRLRGALSREVAEASRAADVTVAGGDVLGEVAGLLARDPRWAVALIRARRTELDEAALSACLIAATTDPARRAGAFLVIACVGAPAAREVLQRALDIGDLAAIGAITQLDEDGATDLIRWLRTGDERIVVARALSRSPIGAALIPKLLGDNDSEVAHVVLRSALAIARGGGAIAAAPIADEIKTALDALLAHLDARDAAAPLSACAKQELELSTRRSVVRLLSGVAVEAAAAGRDPAPLAATARHLIGGREPDRRRALDVIQEMQAGRAEILEVLERWLKPAVASDDLADTLVAIELVDPWLARLARGELSADEPRLVALRKAPLFSTMAGPALWDFARRVTQRTVTGVLFENGAPGDTMFVVLDGAMLTRRPRAPDRRIDPGGVVGELAVLTRAPRAATVLADPSATVLEIDRATFAAATRRAPELVLGLSATLAGWLAPERPDVLGGTG